MPRTPFNILLVGNRWLWFARLVEAKGPEAMRLTKVKGHATDQMVSLGKVTKEHTNGTDAADEAADIGVEQHGHYFLEASTFVVAKQKEYGSFMKEMYILILVVMKEVVV